MALSLAGVRAMVTGGSGFVGGALIAALRAAGAEVVGLARSHRAARAVAAAGAAVAYGELEDRDSLVAAMRGCALTFHAAAKTNEWGTRADFYAANVAGTEHVIAAARTAGIRRLVHVSTEAVIAGDGPVIAADESTPYAATPAGLYGWSKQLGEQAVRSAHGAGLETCVVRPRLVWGVGDRALLPGVAAAMRDHRWIWWGETRDPTSTCHVDNLTEALLLAATTATAGGVHFVTDGDDVPMRTFLASLVDTWGQAPSTLELPRWLGWGAAMLGEALWRRLGLPGQPPIERTTMALTFTQITVRDPLARRELGYVGRTGRAAGLAALRAAGPPGERPAGS